MKKLIEKYKLLKTKPRLYSLFKLLLWVPFFALIFILNAIATNNNELIIDNRITTDVKKITFTDIKNNFLKSNLSINYIINDYFIEGTIEDSVLNGTLETSETLEKISIDNDNLYIVKKNEKTIDTNLLSDINKKYLLPITLFKLLDDYSSVTKIEDNLTLYIYEIDNNKIVIYTNEDKINKVEIESQDIKYELNFTYDL